MKSESEITETNTSKTVYKTLYDFTCYLIDLSHKGIAIITFFILWELLPTIGIIDSTFIPTPSTIALATWGMLFSSDFIFDTVITLSRVFLGLGIALAVGIPLGYLLGGFFKDFEKAVEPLLQLLGQLNPWSVFHLFIVFLGIGELSVIGAVFYISLWPVLYNTVASVKNVDHVLFKVAKAACMGKFQIFWKVIIPASLPIVFAGIRLGALLAFFMAIGGEMMGAGDGLGYLIMWYQMYSLIPQMWAVIVTISLLGMIFIYILLQLERYFTNWKEDIAFS
ncbi:ABC transporter permease [Methanobacterium sp.]|uniref:ABC transporter permease n=1 Tax=Methanobacterium sp. TaxID=2164 RepID=UPI003C78B342